MKPETEAPKKQDGNESQEDKAKQKSEIHVVPKQKPEDLVVPLVDEHEAGRIYDPSLLHLRSGGIVVSRLWRHDREFMRPGGLHSSGSERDEPTTAPYGETPGRSSFIIPPDLYWALWGAVLGGLLLGWLGYGIAEGGAAIAGLGQWAASGTTLGAVTGGGIGLAAGGLIGALLALYRMPARRPEKEEEPRDKPVIVETAPEES